MWEFFNKFVDGGGHGLVFVSGVARDEKSVTTDKRY
jgi:hypothetical protein